jgi:hypothetical protein
MGLDENAMIRHFLLLHEVLPSRRFGKGGLHTLIRRNGLDGLPAVAGQRNGLLHLLGCIQWRVLR